MDQTTRQIAEYVTDLRYGDLSADAIHQAKKHLVDTFACAIGGFHSPPARIARQLAGNVSARLPAQVLGTRVTTSPEMATFANSTMVRFLDYNDSYISTGAGHPSDVVPACLAVAEASSASGKETLLSIIAAYEVFATLADAIPLRERGWDQGFFAVLASAAGASRLLGLSRTEMAEALSIAVSSSVATRQARAGELSMWKGAATAAAARAGVFAALLAQAGMTGPTEAFEGKHGIWEQVTGAFDLGEMGAAGKPLGIERTHLKFFPSEFHSQVPLALALDLRKDVSVDQIRSLHVRTYYMAYSEIGSEPEKWHPTTRETADHSLPFLLASVLTDGRITPASFDAHRLRDPSLLSLMQRIEISQDDDFTRRFPDVLNASLELQTTDGRRQTTQAEYPRGHVQNPMTDSEVEDKLRGTADGLLAPEAQAQILSILWHFEEDGSLDRLFELIQLAE